MKTTLHGTSVGPSGHSPVESPPMATDDEPNEFADEDPVELLAQAREKAGQLLHHLIAEQAKIEQNPPKTSPEALTEGRAAMANAIASARRTVEVIDAAIAELPDEDKPRKPGDDQHRWN